MKSIIIFVLIFSCVIPVFCAQPTRENGLSVHIVPKSAPQILGAKKGGFMISQPHTSTLPPLRPILDTPEQLVEYFLQQPREIQENGLWVVVTNPKAYSDEEIKNTEILKKLCREKNILLFFCRAMALPNGWVTAEKFSLSDSDSLVSNMLKAETIEDRANRYASEGNYDKALELYNEALCVTAHPAYVMHDRGMAYVNKGGFEKAISDFNKAMEMNQNEKNFVAQCHNDRGVAYFHSGQYEKSWQDVKKAIELGYQVHPGFLAALKSKGYSQ